MFLSSLKSYAKKKLLGSKTVIAIVASVVETVMCTTLETIVLGSSLFVIKEFVSPFDWMDVLVVDIGCNVAYVLTAMSTVRSHLHPLLDKPCKKIARKILGLDIRNPWEFIKIKYTIMISIILTILLFMYNTHDVAAFLRLTCFEVFVIHACVDVWTFRGKDISDYIEEQLEPRPEVKLLKLSDSHETKEENNKRRQTPKPVKLDTMILENYFE
jgi:hypothetical protein